MTRIVRAVCAILAMSLAFSHARADDIAYDSLNRITSIRYDNGYEVSYTYDPAGNILAKAVSFVPSTNAVLSGLSVSSGTLVPAFASGTTSYAVTVDASVTTFTVTPTVADAYATVRVNGVTLASGIASTPIALAQGTTTITILVTAQDGSTTRTYTLSVTRACDTAQPGDCDNDGIPNAVEAAEGRNPLLKDNDIFSPGPAPARLFAMQMYRDFLNREGDAAGIQGWADVVANGSWTRLQVIDAFLQSQEFAGFVAPVVRLYFATYLRVPDYDGLTFNAGLVRNGTVTLTQLADFFTASPEFLAMYGSMDNAAFVTLLYNNVLGRAPDAAGLSGWVALLNGGYTRGQVLLGFSDSVEYQASMANEVFVTMMYAGMLRRTPEPTGFSGWVGFLDAGTYSREQVINGFFLSTEYRGRFLP